MLCIWVFYQYFSGALIRVCEQNINLKMFIKISISLTILSVMLCQQQGRDKYRDRFREPSYENPEKTQSVLGRGLYECDKESYFDTIVRSIEGQQEPNQCNSFKVRKRDDMVYGLKKGRYIPLSSNGFYALLDNNGSEHYIRMGSIIGGECDNSSIFLQNLMVVSNGSCRSREGVSQLQSVQATYVIQGHCYSSCSGEATINYWPGKSE